jgi:hypothetical protein
MRRYRLVVVGKESRPGDRLVIPFADEPSPGGAVELPGGNTVTISHVISTAREGLEGIVLAYTSAPPEHSRPKRVSSP